MNIYLSKKQFELKNNYFSTIGLILLIFISIATSSCMRIIMAIGGIKNPRIETEESLLQYCKSKELDSSIVFLYTPDSSMGRFLQIRIPSLYVYDSGKELVMQSGNGVCTPAVWGRLIANDSIPDYYQPNDSLNEFRIDSLLSCFKSWNQSMINSNELNPDSKYYIFVEWAKYAPGPLKRSIRNLTEIETANSDIKISYYFINMDYRKEWFPYDLKKTKRKLNLNK